MNDDEQKPRRRPGARTRGSKMDVMHIVITPEQRRRIETAADQRAMSMSEIFRQALDAWLAVNEPEHTQ